MTNDYRKHKLLLGVVLGAGVGVAGVLLLAPQSGRETRDLIRVRGLVFKSSVGELNDESRKRAQDLGNQARDRMGQMQARGRLAIEEQGTRLQKTIDQGKEAYEKMSDGVGVRLK
jgi:gas vesicle protein